MADPLQFRRNDTASGSLRGLTGGDYSPACELNVLASDIVAFQPEVSCHIRKINLVDWEPERLGFLQDFGSTMLLANGLARHKRSSWLVHQLDHLDTRLKAVAEFSECTMLVRVRSISHIHSMGVEI